ncbi:ABC transporter ATP-binding protein [Actinomadura vinacea]|uniref:ABC transporter ATP-binding protein n=1 Tax=Actinomadura vinacea TaxID=115336 RepID=A0ABP5WMU2_9ACTN
MTAVREMLRGQRRAVLAVLAWSTVTTLPALVSGRLVALAADRGFLRERPWTGVAWLAVLGAVMVAGSIGARYVPSALSRVVEPMRDRLVRRVVTGTLRRLVSGERPDPGVVARISEHAETVRDNAAGLLQGLQQVVLTVLAAVAGLLLLAPAVALLIVPPVLLSLLLIVWMLPSLVERRRALLLAEERVAGSAGRVCGAIRDVVACGAESRALADARADIAAQARAERAVGRADALRVGLALTGGQLALLVVLLAAPWLVRSGHLSPGEVLGALTYVITNLQPALRAAVHTTGGSGVEIAVTLRRLEEAAATTDVPEPAGTRTAPDDTLVLDGVTFAYGAGAEPVVHDLSFTLTPGSHLAIVGPSGVGKSTLADLLCGLTAPQRGTVSIGGVTLPEADPAWLRRTVAIIPQEAYVFAGALADNLAYLRPSATPDELDAAVAAVGLGPLRDRLGGTQALLPRGLTPGERQLIALARVWLSPARVVVLDEATCHLDPPAEARVEAAFRRRPGTLIVIAHRLTSARRADRILVMDGPRTLLADHPTLLARSPLYATLHGTWHRPPAHTGGPSHGRAR